MNVSKSVLYLLGTAGFYLLVITALLRAQDIVVRWGVYKAPEGHTVYGRSMQKLMLYCMGLVMIWLGVVLVILLTRLALIALKA